MPTKPLTAAQIAELKRMCRYHLKTRNRGHFVSCLTPLLELQGVQSPWITAHRVYTKRTQG